MGNAETRDEKGPDMPADSSKSDTARRHHRITEPSPWITRFAPLVPENGAVLDLACGNGRHGRIFLARGNPVVFIDRDVHAVANLAADPNAEVIEADLEDGGDWPFAGRRFAAILVSNYLHRPLFPHILDSIETGGVLIYETFARGNERFCRPRNPDHLLRAGELLERLDGRFHVVAYEHGLIESGPIPGVIQRVCAVHDRPADEETDPDPRPVLPRPA